MSTIVLYIVVLYVVPHKPSLFCFCFPYSQYFSFLFFKPFSSKRISSFLSHSSSSLQLLYILFPDHLFFSISSCIYPADYRLYCTITVLITPPRLVFSSWQFQNSSSSFNILGFSENTSKLSSCIYSRLYHLTRIFFYLFFADRRYAVQQWPK